MQARESFKAAVNRWAGRIKARPAQIRIRRMTRKWASCSARGRISFNCELLAQPRGFQEAAVVHELLHLKVPNHGKLFKSLMNAYLPGWERRRPRAAHPSCG
jgi:predicted metal-dependent hydrolase